MTKFCFVLDEGEMKNKLNHHEGILVANENHVEKDEDETKNGTVSRET